MRYLFSLILGSLVGAALVCELIDVHAINKADEDHPSDHRQFPHVVSEEHGPRYEETVYTYSQVKSVDNLVAQSQTREEQRAERTHMTEAQKVAAINELWGRQ